MTNKLIEDAVAELETLTGDDHQTEYYPVSADLLRNKLTDLLTAQLTELEGEMKSMRGTVFGNDVVARADVTTIIAEQKELLARDNN